MCINMLLVLLVLFLSSTYNNIIMILICILLYLYYITIYDVLCIDNMALSFALFLLFCNREGKAKQEHEQHCTSENFVNSAQQYKQTNLLA